MDRKGRMLAALAGLALGMSLAGTKPALAQGERECQTKDLAGKTVDNTCTNCTLTITSGTLTICEQTVTDSLGGKHYQSQVYGIGKAVDCAGNAYVVIVNEQLEELVKPNTALNSTLTATLRLLSQGQAPDFHCLLRIRFTLDANGNPHAEVEEESEDCGCLVTHF